MSSEHADHYDLVIVGAGMVGASLACILDRVKFDEPFHILLVESAAIDLDAPPAQPSFDARSTVLSHGTVSYFRELGLWDSLQSGTAPIKRIHVSDQGKFGAVRMNSDEQGVEALGHVVENRILGNMFNRALSGAAGLELCSHTRVSDIAALPDGMQVTLEHNQAKSTLTTDLVVLAEGGRSGLCEKLGINRSTVSYDQQAIIANVAFSKSHENLAFERFTPNGPLALLPLPDLDGEHRAALVWTQHSEEVAQVCELPDAEFLSRLQEEFGGRVGKFTRVGERHSYPLSLVQADEQVRPGLVLLGNVAHSLHPVAGQGFNLAFRDTTRLAARIIDARKRGNNPGQIHYLQAYLDETLHDQEMTAGFSHYMTRLFSKENPAAVWARKFGLFSIDLVFPLRKAFARRAMGMGGSRVKLEGKAI